MPCAVWASNGDAHVGAWRVFCWMGGSWLVRVKRGAGGEGGSDGNKDRRKGETKKWKKK